MAKIVSFSLDKNSLDLISKIEASSNYKNRSEMLRSALQLLLNEQNDLNKMTGHIDAVVVVTHSEKNEEDISKIKHYFGDIISTQIHNNMHSICMQTFIVHGNAETIRSFVKMLKESQSVSYVKVITLKED